MQCVPCESKKLSFGMGIPFDYWVKDRKVNLVDDFQGLALLYYVNFNVIELMIFNVGLSFTMSIRAFKG